MREADGDRCVPRPSRRFDGVGVIERRERVGDDSAAHLAEGNRRRFGCSHAMPSAETRGALSSLHGPAHPRRDRPTAADNRALVVAVIIADEIGLRELFELIDVRVRRGEGGAAAKRKHRTSVLHEAGHAIAQ